MSEITPFEFPSTGQPVRTLLVDGQPWLVARDVCDALGIENVTRALAGLDEDEKGLHTVNTPGGPQQMAIVNEAGLYSLILRSRKPEAKAFKRWITHEVLPTIRKTGSYGSHALPQNFAEALELAAKQARELEATTERAEVAEQQVAALAPKAEAHDAFLVAPKSDRTVGQVAKLLDWRECDLRGFLLDEKLIFIRKRPCDGTREYNYMATNKAHFSQVETRVHHSDLAHNHYTLYVTPRGIDLIRKRIADRGDSGQLVIDGGAL